MSWMSSAFGGGSSYTNPADVAMPYLEKVPGEVSKYYNPYISLGQRQGNQAAFQYGKMARDPGSYYQDMMSSYQPSDAYKYNQKQLTDQAGATAAAGGYSGTEQDVQNQEEITNGLLGQDEQQYYNNLMQILGGGLSGEQNMYGIGYGASNSAADDMVGNLNAQAGLAYKGQENQNAYNQANANSFAKLISQGIGIGADYFLK